MSRRVRSLRYANRMLRVGRLQVVFRGEYADIPDWAEREHWWLVHRVPGVFEVREEPAPSEPAAPAPAAEPPVPEEQPPVAVVTPAPVERSEAEIARRERPGRRPR